MIYHISKSNNVAAIINQRCYWTHKQHHNFSGNLFVLYKGTLITSIKILKHIIETLHMKGKNQRYNLVVDIHVHNSGKGKQEHNINNEKLGCIATQVQLHTKLITKK